MSILTIQSFIKCASLATMPLAIIRCRNCRDLLAVYKWVQGSCTVCGGIIHSQYDNDEQFIELCDNGYNNYSEQEMVDCIWAHEFSVDAAQYYANPERLYHIEDNIVYVRCYICLTWKPSDVFTLHRYDMTCPEDAVCLECKNSIPVRA